MAVSAGIKQLTSGSDILVTKDENLKKIINRQFLHDNLIYLTM